MKKKTYSRSVAKYIRRQKSFIRRRVQDPDEQKKLIQELLRSLNRSKPTS